MIAEVRERIQSKNLTGAYAYPEAVGAISAIISEEEIKYQIQKAIWSEERRKNMEFLSHINAETPGTATPRESNKKKNY